MLIPWRLLRQKPVLPQHYRLISDARPFREGDIILLREKISRSAPPILTRPLQPGKRIDNHRGVLHHDDLIGKRVRDVVATAPGKKGGRGTEYRLHEVKMEEYVRLSKRLVTPVYPADAGLIVELLDLHPNACDESGSGEDGTKLEILEAGTGHGALTLYLSRAIHGANAPLPPRLDNDSTEEDKLELWKQKRRAIIHTIDISANYSAHAQKVTRGFRRGLYYNNIDFYVTDVGSWVRKSLADRSKEPFLSHAILDLPNADQQLAGVAESLRCDGTLIVFNPSITQITQCATKIKDDGIPLDLDRVIELPLNGGAGGREWDVRPVKPRAMQKLETPPDADGTAAVQEGEENNDDDSTVTEESSTSAIESEDGGGREGARIVASETEKGGWAMVCRPKVGERIVGGGFLGVWKKKRDL